MLYAHIVKLCYWIQNISPGQFVWSVTCYGIQLLAWCSSICYVSASNKIIFDRIYYILDWNYKLA